MFFIALVLACPAPSDGPTDTDTETSAPETESEVDERALDLESSGWWWVESGTHLPDQDASNWCSSAQPADWTWVSGIGDEAGDCWTASGACYQDLAFLEDGSVQWFAYFVVTRCADGEEVPVQGIQDYGTWSFVSDDGLSSTTYEVNGATWVISDVKTFGWDVTVEGGHVFTIAPESLEIPIIE